jgi:hypothetical protein
MVDPVYEVNPLMAATDLASNIVFTPLAVFGKNNENRRLLVSYSKNIYFARPEWS